MRRSSSSSSHASRAPDADFFLVKDKPSYIGPFLQLHANRISEAWRGLRAVARGEEPPRHVDRPDDGAELWPELVDSLFAMNFAAAQVLGSELARLHPDGSLRVLDVGAGAAVWSIGCARVEPRVRATALDLEGTLPSARAHVERFELTSRFDYLAGDLRELDFGEQRFEAVVLGHICHAEGRANTRKLLAKCARALVPGGTLAIAEFVPDDDRSGPVGPLLFALNMLVNTTDGDTFTLADFREMCAECGLRDVRTLDAPAPSPLILATR